MALTPLSSATPILLLSLLAIASAGDYGYGPGKQDKSYLPKPHVPLPKLDYSKDLTKNKLPKSENGYGPTLPIAIHGLVLCKSGSKFVPIKGAVARIVCSAEDQYGHETTPFSCLTDPSDEKGYFFKTLPFHGIDVPFYGSNGVQLKYKECKAYLESSSLKTCKVRTDTNNGITGALFSSYRILNDKKIKLYSVGPFICTSELKPTPDGHY